MKALFFVVFAILFVLNGTAPHASENQLVVSKRLPKISSSMTNTQKEQILNGVKGAVQFFKFLQEKNFFATLTKLSSVAGPIFSVVSGILTVIFMFIDIESPEMALMKKEFAQLNSRIDRWGLEFKEIKRKIDWSAVQINFGDVENNIISLHKMISDLGDLSKESRQTHFEIFINNYEINYKAAGDFLYRAMMNIEQIYSVNLFRAAQRFMENDRPQVQEFMVELMTLLTQSIQLEAFYVKLKYDDPEASNFTQSLWEKKLVLLKEKMEQIDLDTKEKYKEQYEIDLDNLLLKHRSLSNQEFAKVAMDFYFKKYNWRTWFILVYNEVYGFDNHAVSTCQGTHRFRKYGRNIVVSSVDNDDVPRLLTQMKLKNEVISSSPATVKTRNYSLEWIEHFRKRLDYCHLADTVASVVWGGGVWYIPSSILVYKKNCFYGNWCYNTFIFG